MLWILLPSRACALQSKGGRRFTTRRRSRTDDAASAPCCSAQGHLELGARTFSAVAMFLRRWHLLMWRRQRGAAGDLALLLLAL